MSAQAKVPFTVKGRHVLFGVVGFFAVVIALDSLFVTWAVQTFPGEVSTRAYEDGLAYNRTLAARQEQKALGWTAKVLQGAQPGAVRVAFAGPSGETLDGLAVKAAFTRPATDEGGREAALRNSGGGTYTGQVPLEAGAWDVKLTAADKTGRVFEAERRLVWR